MVTLSDAISVLYPQGVPLIDYTIVDSGSGPVIVSWNEITLGKRPTKEAIAAVTEQMVQASRVGKLVQTSAVMLEQGIEPPQIIDRGSLRVLVDLLNMRLREIGKVIPTVTPMLEAEIRTAMLAAWPLGVGLPGDRVD